LSPIDCQSAAFFCLFNKKLPDSGGKRRKETKKRRFGEEEIQKRQKNENVFILLVDIPIFGY